MQLSKEPMPHLETPVRAFERSRPARLALPDAPRQKLSPGLPLEVADSTATLKKPIKLLLANHHPVVRWGLRSCLAEHARVKVVGEAADGVEALRRARELAPDVVAMDVDLPHMSGVAVARALRKALPRIKVLLLCLRQHINSPLGLLRSGATGFVLKDASPEELLRAVESVANGETFFSEAIERAALNEFVNNRGQLEPLARLTKREREVLTLIAEGQSNKEIAYNLGIAVRTVEVYRGRLMRRLDIRSVAGLTSWAIANGLAPLQA